MKNLNLQLLKDKYRLFKKKKINLNLLLKKLHITKFKTIKMNIVKVVKIPNKKHS